MATNVFISWSGELSGGLAEALHGWLRSVIQSVRPYYTSLDIMKGAKWGPDIWTKLRESRVGIICLTSDNLNSPWIHYEAGALSNNKDAYVCTLLFNLKTTDVAGPLAGFQHTVFEKAQVGQLMHTINDLGTAADKLPDNLLNEAFEQYWPRLEGKANEILEKYGTAAVHKPRDERDMLEEVLELTRQNARRSEKEQLVLDAIMNDYLSLNGSEDYIRAYARKRHRAETTMLGQATEEAAGRLSVPLLDPNLSDHIKGS